MTKLMDEFIVLAIAEEAKRVKGDLLKYLSSLDKLGEGALIGQMKAWAPTLHDGHSHPPSYRHSLLDWREVDRKKKKGKELSDLLELDKFIGGGFPEDSLEQLSLILKELQKTCREIAPGDTYEECFKRLKGNCNFSSSY